MTCQEGTDKLGWRHNSKEDKTVRIDLDIQDQNLTPEAREILIGLLHRLEKEPEKFTAVDSPVRSLLESDKNVDVAEFLRRARAERKPLQPITPQEFFSRIMETKGFESKEAAHQHIQDLRAEWD
jgi:hypothetical protein